MTNEPVLENRLPARLSEGRLALSAWFSTPHPLVQEAFLGADFDLVTFDMQHGMHEAGEIRDGVALACRFGRPAVVRVPVGAYGLASWALDMGASGIIMPMIETVADTQALVKAVKYPPLGLRSYGPARAADLMKRSAADYVAGANRETLAFAMIETQGAMAALEDIAKVDGLDGLFVGPADLSIALSDDGRLDIEGDRLKGALERIVAATEAAGKIPGIYAPTPDHVRHYAALGFRYVCVSSDIGVVKEGARRLAEEARG